MLGDFDQLIKEEITIKENKKILNKSLEQE
jgi:hypothetical protein